MGTRNLTMVISNNEIKVAQYGQWDGYPSGQGSTCLNFLKKANLDLFKEKVNKTKWLSDEEMDVINNDENWKLNYPYLSRDMASDILEYIYNNEPIKLSDKSDFANDSLFCEWGYVIDLDKNVFEVYVGFNHCPLNENDRFYKKDQIPDGGYYPIKILKSYSLSELPETSDFIKELEETESE